MIQEKDFLYRVPVKTAPITTPGGQIRNPEILVDVEGGEFMHGNILDANSTNKLINQSVKDAVDDKFIETGHVTKDLLEAETSARTKGDEDLSANIKAEQTRAEGKEKEISDKLAIVDGDSNTEGSFRKAIADVIAAAPEDLDTLKEIADKLAGNDDLHTELNRAITEKADASALANEVSRATGAESNLQAAIGAKQDAGNYIPYDDQYKQVYIPDRTLRTRGNNIEAYSNGSGNDRSILQPGNILVEKTDGNRTHTAKLNIEGLTIRNAYKDIYIDKDGFRIFDTTGNIVDINNPDVKISSEGIEFANKSNKEIPTADGTFIVVDDFASIDDVSSLRAGLSRKQDKITVNEVDITDIKTADITKLRTIVTNLINALSESDLIRQVAAIE